MTRTHDLLITNQLLYRLSYTSDFDIITIRDKKVKYRNDCASYKMAERNN